MRTLLLSLLTLTALGCRCSPATPVPITMKVVNSTRDPIYVDATRGKLGLTVQRDVAGTLFEFDDLACTCRYCSNVCDSSCSCPDAGSPQIRRVDPGTTAERQWDGVVQISGVTSCGDGSCLSQENAPTNEPFTLKLCWTNQRPSGVQFSDAGVGQGELTTVSLTCIDKKFELQDGVVEIGPARGAACTTSADCKGLGELCFDNACTTGCPANDFPELGSNWSLLVSSPDNMGFFVQSPRTTGFELKGQGTITAVVYQGTSLQVSLTRPGLPNEMLTGKVTVQLPPMTGAPLQVGQAVTVTVVDDGKTRPNRAVVMRDSMTDAVLFAADMAQDGALLTAMDLTPFSLSWNDSAIGCRIDGCGKLLFFKTKLTGVAGSVEVEPGKRASLASNGNYSLLNVSAGRYAGTTRCDVSDIRPWVLWRE